MHLYQLLLVVDCQVRFQVNTSLSIFIQLNSILFFGNTILFDSINTLNMEFELEHDPIQKKEEDSTIEKRIPTEAQISNSVMINLTIEDPSIHNIVATANFCCNLDLAKIVTRVRNAEYNPKRFRAVIMRIFEPRTTAMLFSSGKIVCTGAKSERLASIAARKYGRIMQKLGYEVSINCLLIRPKYVIFPLILGQIFRIQSSKHRFNS